MRVLYITYIDTDSLSSGSAVRPAKMLKAFQEEGHELIVLSGNQVGENRRTSIRNVLQEVKRKRPDICYIESPTYPIMLHADRKLIKTIHKMGIPIGYFYRDFYRKFPLQSRKTGILRRVKDWGLDFLQWCTDRVLRYCDIVYLPSEACKELFSYKDMRTLPPAGSDNLFPEHKAFGDTCIYVGGIGGHYDGKLLLDAFQLLAERDPRFHLILVCREKEWDRFEHPCKQAAWLEVHHTSGDGLTELYRRASVGLVVHKKHAYNRYAIPIKTFEYMSYGLPIVSVDVESLAMFIRQEGVGKVVDASPAAYADGIQQILQDPESYQGYAAAVRQSLFEKNLWVHRVRQVTADLTGAKDIRQEYEQ